MAQTIKLKRSATSGATPTTSQLELGEVAINTYDGKMYIKKDVGGTESIVEITGGSGGSSTLSGLSDVTISSAAADQLLQYNGSEWVNVSIAEASAIMKEYQFTATAGQSTFSGSDDNSETLSYTAGAIQVFLNGIFLDSAVDYTATNGTSIVLSETVDANDYLQVVAFKKKIGDGNVSVDTFTGDDSTTAFTLSVDPGDENNTRVFIDGVYQSKDNYSVSGTTLTFSTAPPTDTAIEVEIGNRVVTLDTLSDLDLPDDVKLRLGTGQDLQIYHDGSHSYINDTGTGDLIIKGGNDILFQDAVGNTLANMNQSNSVELYFGNSKKFETTSTGVDVTGTAAADALSVDSITIDGTEIDSSSSLMLDIAGNLTVNVDGTTVTLADDAINFGQFYNNASGQFNIYAPTQDKDIVFLGNDGGSTVTALTLDMSDGGTAILASHLDMGDNQKIRLGASDDLQLFHDGSNSYIQNGTTGNINITNTAGGEFVLVGVANGGTFLYHDGTSKFQTTSTGVTVTGTVTSDAYNVSSGGIGTGYQLNGGTVLNYSGGNVVVGDLGAGVVLEYSGSTKLATTSTGVDVTGSVTSDSLVISGTNANLTLGTSGNNIDFGRNADNYISAQTGSTSNIVIDPQNRFVVRTADTERMRIDSSGRVGIGTTSPSVRLDTRLGTTTGKVAEFHNSVGYGLGFTVESDGGVNTINSESNQALAFATNGASNERMRIGSDGNVAIGTTSTSAIRLNSVTPTANHIAAQIENTNTADSFGLVVKGGNDANDYAADFRKRDNTNIMRIRGDGNVGIGTSSPSYLLHVNGGNQFNTGWIRANTGTAANPNFTIDGGAGMFKPTSNVIGFSTNSTERLRIASGNPYMFLGNTGHSWGTFHAVAQIGRTGAVATYDSGANQQTIVANNTYYGSGGYTSIEANSAASYMNANQGHVSFFTAPAIAAGSVQTFTQRFQIHRDGNVGIGTATPSTSLDIERSSGNATQLVNATANNTRATIETKAKTSGGVEVRGVLGSYGDATKVDIGTLSNHNLSILTNNTERVRFTASGNVGIGRTDPTQLLEVHKNAGGDQTVAKFSAHNYGDTGKTFIEIGTEYGDGSSRIGSFNDTGNSSVLVFDTHSATSGQFTERMRIKSDGKVGIGTNSPSQLLNIEGATNPAILVTDTTNTTSLLLRSQNNTSSVGTISNHPLVLETNATERMRIASSGDWMVSNTVANVASAYTNQGGCGWVDSDLHFEAATTSNRSAAEFGRNNANSGDVITIRQQSTSIGMIGTEGGDSLVIQSNGSTGTGIRFHPSRAAVEPVRQGVTIDDTISLGADTRRFKDLHLSGTSYTNQVELAEISTSNSDVPNDIFIYDTRKDSDGGAWRYRTQHTTWYNETLNTSTRGARKEFPAVAVIIVESDQVTIYDGDDPDMPMWMVFNAGSDMSNETILRGTAIRGAAMLNGILCVATADTLVYIRFIDEYHNLFHTSAEYFFPARTGIVDRNVVIAEPQQRVGGENGTYYGIASSGTKSVSMTVLPNAPIHPTCGLPIPTVGVACGTAGNSIIRHDGKVVDIISGDSTEQAEHAPVFLKDGRVAIQNYDDDRGWRIMSIPEENITIQNHYNRGGTFVLEWYNSWNHAPSSAQLGDITVRGKGVNPGDVYIPLVEANEHIAIGHNNDGVSLVARQPDDPVNGMSAFIEKDYNTGWMPGATKLAMAPTDSTTFASTEMITNGAFSNGTTGWSGATATVSESGGVLTVTGTASSVQNQSAQATVTGTTTPGEQYILTFQIVEHVANKSSSGIIVGNGQIVENNHLHYWYPNSVGTHTTTIVATSTYLTVSLHAGTAVGVITKFDNVSLFRAEPDRSARHRATQISGSVTRVAVATSAELRAYENFSSGNFMFQNYYNDELNFGTGDFAIACWVKAGSTNSYRRFISLQNPSGAQTDNDAINIKFSPQGTNNQYIYTYLGSTEGTLDTPDAAINVWHHVVLTRRGNHYNFYFNGKLTDTKRSSQSKGSANHKLYIGKGAEGNEVFTGGSITLIKIAKGTAPSSEQVARMYRDELCMFDENSNITLYGSSSGVRGLAHDNDTNLLHVGTSSGRSVFRGLRRVENTTTAVGSATNAAISASNGLVVENT